MPSGVPLCVSVRLRPVSVPESEQGHLQLGTTADPSNGIVEPRAKLVQLYDADKQHLSEFSFDNVFPASSTSSDVFSTIGQPLVQHVLSGYNACCFAYGQTGSGKTHNMQGAPSDQKGDTKGLIPQCVEHLFTAIKQMEGNGSKISVFISFIEIYQEHVRDLGKAVSRLHETEGTKRATSAGSRPSSGRPPRPPSAATRRILEELAQESLDVVEDTAGNTSVRALTYIEVSTVAEASMFLSGGTSLRATAATEQNDVSSRSHTVFTISVINCGPDSASSTLPGPDAALAGRLHMIDLAGSEDLRRSGSGSEEQRLAEARSINSSLSTLGKVVMLLGSGTASTGAASHIPFRDSKLTRILKDSLGGNCLTHLLACVYPHPANTRECLSTLQFALRCANVKTSPVVNTVTVPSKTSNDSNSNALIAELTKEVADLQRELDDTHAHYHKLLEGSKPGQFDYGPIERAADASALAEAEAAAEEEAAVQGRAPENSSDSVQDSKRPGSSTGAAKADEAGGLTRSSTLANRAEIGKPRTAVSGRASGASQEQMQQVRSLEAQLEKMKWKFNESTNHLRTVKDDHEQLLQYSSQQSGKAVASQRRSAATISKLKDELQQISEDHRNESATATQAAAEERDRLLQQVDTLTRHNTQLIKSIPEMISKHRAECDMAARESEAKEGDLRAWFASTITEMEDTVARRVNFADASTEQAIEEGTTETQALQRQLDAATEQSRKIDQEWQKEAGVLWRYCDRLAALLDLIAAGGVAKPHKPPPATLPRGSDFITPLTWKVNAATASSFVVGATKGCLANDEDPGRMDAATLKRTLRAVAAVESYLANSGRLNLDTSESTQDLQAAGKKVAVVDLQSDTNGIANESGASHSPGSGEGLQESACPGWKLALARANAELEKTRQQCSALQQQNADLKDEIVERLPEAKESMKCLQQEEQEAARLTHLQEEAERCRVLLRKEQASHMATHTALQSAQRRLRGRQLDSHHAPLHTPDSTLRPCSAPLSRPANVFQYPPAMHALDQHPDTSQLSHSSNPMPRPATTIRSDHGSSARGRPSSTRGSPGALKHNAGPMHWIAMHPNHMHSGQSSSARSKNGTCSKQRGSQDPFYNRHACPVVEDLVSTSQATIRTHKTQLRAASARPYMRNA